MTIRLVRVETEDDLDLADALDAKGRGWYQSEAGDLEGAGLDDTDIPLWPACLACGQGVDWLHVTHWVSCDMYVPPLILHDECVELISPEPWAK